MANEVPWPLLQLLIGARSRDFLSVPENPAVPAFPDVDLDVGIFAYMGADPTADPSTWPDPVNLSELLVWEPIQSTRGRAAGQRTLSSGSCSFYLNNTNGELTTLLATSPWFGDWDLGVPVKLVVNNAGTAPPYGLFCGFAASIDETIIPGVGGTTLATVKVTLGGVVRQRSQGSVAEDVMHRFIRLRSPRAYWPLTGGQNSTMGFAWTSGTDSMLLDLPSEVDTQAAWSGADLEPWLRSVLHISGTASSLQAAVPGAAPSTAIAFDWVVRNMAGATGAQVQLVARWAASNGLDLYSYAINGNYASGTPNIALNRLTNDAFAASLDTGDSTTANALWDDAAHHWRILVEDSGADVNVTAYLDGVAVMSGTHTTSQLRAGSVHRTELTEPDGGFGYAAVYVDGDIPDVVEAASAMAGYAGEQAHARIARVCTEEGIPFSTSTAESQPCGPQWIADILTTLRDAELVDHGMLRESLATWGLTYLGGQDRYNRPAAMTIDLSTYRLSDGSASSSDVLTPVRNDQRIRNEWAISRPSGGEITVADEDHQSRHGRYPDSAEVNVEDDDALADEASWRVHEGTYGGKRYRTAPLDLGANNGGSDGSGDLLGAWLAMDLGDRIDRTNPPSPHPPDTVTATLEGYTQTIDRKGWTVAPVIETFDTWVVGVYATSTDAPGPADPERYSPNQSLVGTDFVAGTDTSLAVVAQDSDSLWSTTADFPFDIRLAPVGVTAGGIRLRVSAIGAASGMNQTMTVAATPVNATAAIPMTRTAPAGWEVSLWQLADYAQ